MLVCTLLPANSAFRATAVEGAMKDVISNFWNDDQIMPAAVIDRLVAAAKVK